MGVVNHVVKVRRRTVSVCDARIVANNVDVDTVTLDLDSEWGGLSTVVAFGDGDDQVMVSVGVEPVEIPRSLTTASGYLPVTVIGYGGDGLPRMVTAAAPHAMIIVNSGVVPDQSHPDAPDLIGQLVTVGDKANEAADNANAAADRADAAAEAAGDRVFYAYPYPPDSGCCVIEYPAFLGYNGNTGVYINLETEE